MNNISGPKSTHNSLYKVGIISMQRVINYGSFLQAYALKSIIETLGGDCYFIDIKKGIQLPGNKIDGPLRSLIKRIIRVSIKLITNYKQTITTRTFSRILKEKFINFYYDILGLSKKHEGRYDLVIVGSDEVFNCCEKSAWGFSRQLFGDGVDADIIISYAASFGHTTIDKLHRFNLIDDLSKSLTNFTDISVRDNNSSEIITSLLGHKPSMHLDPVLIYDFHKETEQIQIDDSSYIIIYTYVDRIKDKKEIKAIKQFAEKHNKKLISIFCWYTWCDQILIPDTPFDVLAYFKKADFIITDTFHGTIFSIISQRKFGTIVRDSNREKLTSLLYNFSLASRIINDISTLDDIMTAPISYEETNRLIRTEKDRSIEYLKNHLNMVQARL
jgi:hypothetical protein